MRMGAVADKVPLLIGRDADEIGVLDDPLGIHRGSNRGESRCWKVGPGGYEEE
jgi:hypothetical protein